MSEKDTITFEEVRKKIEAHMKIAMKIEDFDITFAKLEADEWRVNIEWKKENETFSNTIAVTLDAKTGELKVFQKDKFWRW